MHAGWIFCGEINLHGGEGVRDAKERAPERPRARGKGASQGGCAGPRRIGAAEQSSIQWRCTLSRRCLRVGAVVPGSGSVWNRETDAFTSLVLCYYVCLEVRVRF